MLIYVDANALYNDPLLRSVQTKKVLDLLEEAGARLVLSPVVVGELERNFTSTAAEAAETSQRRLEKLGRWLDYPVTDALNAIDAVAKQAAKTWAARWLELGQHSRVELGGWPETSVQARVERELNRRRPFMDKEPGTIGHRDAVIWEGFLDLAQRSDDDEGLVFVTADKGFLAKAGLHPDLVHDLAEIGIDAGRVRVIGNLGSLVPMLRDEAIALEGERDERRSWRLVAVNDAIDSVLRNLSEDLFVPVWDARDGGLAEPEFDLGLPLDVEEWSGLDVTEGPGEPRFDDDPVPLGEATTTVHVDVSLRFEGFMTKADWYASTGNDDVQLWDSDWNDHYVVVEGERSVTLDIEVTFGDEDEEIIEAEIVGATVERSPTA